MVYFYGSRKAELYNVKTDIGETVNLVTKNSKKAKELFDLLVKGLNEQEAQFPIDLLTNKFMEPTFR